MTTPAMNLPWPSVTPDAVRNSVSIFSLITGARAGITLFSSASDAARQRLSPAYTATRLNATTIRIANLKLRSFIDPRVPRRDVSLHDSQRMLRYAPVMARLVFCGLLMLTNGLAVMALDPGRGLREFGRQVWLSENGLPQNTVQAIAQTPDGYVWIGTQEGLARFDGVKFDIFDKQNTPALKSNDIRCLLVAHDGALWLATSFGLVRRQNGQFATLTVNDGLPDNNITKVIEDPAGRIWIATTAAVAVYENGTLKILANRAGIQGLPTLNDGSVIVATAAGLETFKNDAVVPPDTHDGSTPNNVTALAQDPNGGLWYGTTDGVWETRAGKTNVYTTNAGLPNGRVTCVHTDRE